MLSSILGVSVLVGWLFLKQDQGPYGNKKYTTSHHLEFPVVINVPVYSSSKKGKLYRLGSGDQILF